jgi:hypothetical protein
MWERSDPSSRCMANELYVTYTDSTRGTSGQAPRLC